MKKFHLLLILLCFAPFTFMCNNAYLDEIGRGNDTEFKPGYPETRVFIGSTFDPSSDKNLLIAGEIVHSSLIYKFRENQFSAHLNVSIDVVDLAEKKAKNTPPITFPIEVTDVRTDILVSEGVKRFKKLVPIEPGKYSISVSVTDLTSEKTTKTTKEVIIPNPNDGESFLTDIQLVGVLKQDDETTYEDLVSYHISDKYDSLRFKFQANNKSRDDLILRTRLLKFDSDTSVARSIGDRRYNSSSIEHLGITYYDEELLESRRRVLVNQGNVSVFFNFANLGRGNYRLEVESTDPDGKLIYKARDFSIKSTNFPALIDIDEYAAPLVYLMRKKEHEELMSISDPKLMKMEMDKYWLKGIENKAKASQIIELFYTRVELANKQFSNFKEGWKTDMGRAFILFGPPLYVDYQVAGMRWIYPFDSGNRDVSIVFRKNKQETKHFPFDHYLIERDQSLSNLEYKYIQAWNDGSILFLNQ
ncbi:MAG: GWxTD domain-containing protein [Balneola sp.]|jgi:GWxTD domain-containing protein